MIQETSYDRHTLDFHASRRGDCVGLCVGPRDCRDDGFRIRDFGWLEFLSPTCYWQFMNFGGAGIYEEAIRFFVNVKVITSNF